MNAFSVKREGNVAFVTMLGSAMDREFFIELPLVFRELDADSLTDHDDVI